MTPCSEGQVPQQIDALLQLVTLGMTAFTGVKMPSDAHFLRVGIALPSKYSIPNPSNMTTTVLCGRAAKAIRPEAARAADPSPNAMADRRVCSRISFLAPHTDVYTSWRHLWRNEHMYKSRVWCCPKAPSTNLCGFERKRRWKLPCIEATSEQPASFPTKRNLLRDWICTGTPSGGRSKVWSRGVFWRSEGDVVPLSLVVPFLMSSDHAPDLPRISEDRGARRPRD